MNKLIIIGNGFDLAHGLKTDYNSFIKWFVTRCFREASFEDENAPERPIHVSNQIFEISASTGKVLYNAPSFSSIEDLVQKLLEGKYTLNDQYQTIELGNKYFNIRGIVKSSLLEGILADKREYNWVDIENHFYQRLQEILVKRKPYIGGINGELSVKERTELLDKLNQELDELKEQLSEYLTDVSKAAQVNSAFEEFVHEAINTHAILEKQHLANEKVSKTPNGFINSNAVKFLDFNYTSLVRQLTSGSDTGYIPIHGTLNNPENPLIFGYGDEIDDDYLKMEKTNINAYLKHIKSFAYFRTNQYSRLVNFVSAEPYVIYIWGHSCGLSDRTLLNMIFEHDNCVGIKIFYHEKEDGRDNFEEITQNIARHFKDKIKMRNRVFNKTHCCAMPQVKHD